MPIALCEGIQEHKTNIVFGYGAVKITLHQDLLCHFQFANYLYFKYGNNPVIISFLTKMIPNKSRRVQFGTRLFIDNHPTRIIRM
jgi:hypothetical protein